jgi:type VI secretion system protein ImpK
MREELANVVYPVFSYGLRLKERLDRGDELNLEEEQAGLRKLLKGQSEAMRWPEFGGQGVMDEADLGRAGATSNFFFGARYALCCWLDEIFIESPTWGDVWKEHAMEQELYKLRDRAYVFWEQVRLAESRQENDALEVYYLCVMLGFRGTMRDTPDKLRAWRDAAEAQINRGRPDRCPLPQEVQPTTNVPPMHGRERLRKVMLAAGVLLGVFVPVAAFVIVNQLGK